MKFAPLTIALLAMACALPTQAADNASGAWGIFSSSDSIRRGGDKTRWRYGFDAQWRRFDRGTGSNQFVLRPSIGYDLNPTMTVWAGYGSFLTDPDVGSNRQEHRWWQQFSWSAKRWDWGYLSLRSRLEERDIERADDVGLRFRQQVQLAIPIASHDVTLITSLEHYLNLRDTDWGARSGFDQLRSYIGVRMPMTDKLTLEAGYLNQYINRSNEDAVNHIASLRLSAKLF